MRKPKRKYTHKVISDALESQIKPIKEESNSNLPEFSFKDLPLSLRLQVESAIKMRKRLGLPDDSKERKEKAIKMFKGDRPR